jgi:Clp amino terminal domain, pathogenicity island component
MYPLERFTERAKRVLTLSQAEAEAAGRAYIDTEHVLLGLLAEEDGIAARALRALGVEQAAVREAVGRGAGEAGTSTEPQIIPTSRVRTAVKHAFDEAQRMGAPYVGTEHLLFGLIVEGEGMAARMLADAGVTIERARDEVKLVLSSGAAEAAFGAAASGPALPLGAGFAVLVRRAQTRAAGRGARVAELEDLLMVMADAAGMGAVERLLDANRARALKEQAIGAMDYEAAARHRQDEQAAKAALARAVEEWQLELAPPST